MLIASTYILTGWMVAVIITIGVLLSKQRSIDPFYTFGPSPSLIILGIQVDSLGIYLGVIIYCIINTCIRNLNSQVVSPWITNVIQDTSVSKTHLSLSLIYRVVLVNSMYTWIDWFIYINLLLAQVDMVIVEFVTDLIITVYLTRMYLNTSPDQVPKIESQQTCETLKTGRKSAPGSQR